MLQQFCALSAEIIGAPIVDLEIQCPAGAKTQKTKVRLTDDFGIGGESEPWVSAYYMPKGLNRYRPYGITEFLWSLFFIPRTIHFGEAMPGIAYLNFNLELCDDLQKAHLVNVARAFFRASGETGALGSALGDVSDFYETSLGLYYSEMRVSWVSPNRTFYQYLWDTAGATRAEKVRGVHWANYYGPEIVARLGKPDELSAEFRLLDSPGDQRMCECFEDGSMLFLLTHKISLFCFPYRRLSTRDDIKKRYVWLYKRLRAADVLL